MEKKIVICIGTDEQKNVRARLSLLAIENGKVISRHYHSIGIEPGADLAALRADNEADITSPSSSVPMAPWPTIPDDEWASVEKFCSILHTPGVVKDWTKKKEARMAQEAAVAAARADAEANAKQEADEQRRAEIAAAVKEALGK